MSYPPLSEVRQSLRVKWYRCPIETRVLHGLLQRSNTQGWLQAGGHFTLWLSTAGLVWLCWSANNGSAQSTSAYWWLAMIIALYAHGIVSSFFVGVAPHELGHGTVFRSAWLNRLFLYMFSFISWWDPFDYASSHTYHHRYTLHPDGDRENLLPLSPRVGGTFLLQMLTINLFTQKGRTFGKGGVLATLAATVRSALGSTGDATIPANEWLIALHRDQPQQHRKSIWWSRFLLAAHGLIVVVALWSGQWIWIFIVTLASFIANVFAYAVGMTQHCGLRHNDSDFRKCVRSVRLNPLLEFLYWRMNWHTEHHMFAGVPCYNLKRLHLAVADNMPAPRTLYGAWKEMRDTWRRQQQDPEYCFDTPVPARLVKSREPQAAEQSRLEQSIGDLAPTGLR